MEVVRRSDDVVEVKLTSREAELLMFSVDLIEHLDVQDTPGWVCNKLYRAFRHVGLCAPYDEFRVERQGDGLGCVQITSMSVPPANQPTVSEGSIYVLF